MEAFKTAANDRPEAFQSVLHALGQSLTCGICCEPMASPHTSNCGHTFCGVCLVKWMEVSSNARRKKSCPICRTEFSGIPVPSLVVKELIASVFTALKAANPETATVIEQIQSSPQVSDAEIHDRFKQLRVGPSRIVDDEDGVQRCPICHWEIPEDEDVCPHCDPDPEEDEEGLLSDGMLTGSDAESLDRHRREQELESEGDDVYDEDGSDDEAGAYDDPEISITQSTLASGDSDDDIVEHWRTRPPPSRRRPPPVIDIDDDEDVDEVPRRRPRQVLDSDEDEELQVVETRPSSRRRYDFVISDSDSEPANDDVHGRSDSGSDSGNHSDDDGNDDSTSGIDSGSGNDALSDDDSDDSDS